MAEVHRWPLGKSHGAGDLQALCLFLALLDQRTAVGVGRGGGTWAPVAWSRGWQTFP